MPSKKQLRAEIARLQAANRSLVREYVEMAATVTLPADQFDKLMAEADQADIATRLAEAAVKPRMFRTNGAAHRFGEPGTYLINGRDQERSGNSGVPCDAESGNFPNIEGNNDVGAD